MGSKITFCLTPAGETVFFRNAEFTDGYEAHIAVIAAKPTPLLEVILYDNCGTPIAGDRQHVTNICQSFVFSVHGGSRTYYVEIADHV